MGIRNMILGSLGALALGLASPEYARADPENITETDYKEKISNSDSIVLFYAGRTRTDDTLQLHQIAEDLFDRLAEDLEGTNIKFLKFDMDRYAFRNKLSGEEAEAKIEEEYGVDTITMIMYKNGKEIDRLRGGPDTIDRAMKEWLPFLRDNWIPTNLTAPNGEYAWRFGGDAQEEKVPYEQ